MSEWKDEDFIVAPGTHEVLNERINQVWFDDQGRRCSSYFFPDDMTEREIAAVAEMDRVGGNMRRYRRENPIDKEAMAWAEAEVIRLGLDKNTLGTLGKNEEQIKAEKP